MTKRCTMCDHVIHKHGSDWQCTEKCHCLMIGCVPRARKFGTEKEEFRAVLETAAEDNAAALTRLEQEE